MTNLFLQDLKYITLDEFKGSSSSTLKEKIDDEIQVVISRAEQRISPLIIDFVSPTEVPIPVKQALVLLTDCMYEKSLRKSTGKIIIEEKDENHSRKYQLEDEKDCMEGEVSELLEPYFKENNDNISGTAIYRT